MSVSERAVRSPGASTRPSAERARAATRKRLLAAGRRLFARRGLHNITTHDIAKAAGFAPGTFYLHFADKAALFREIAHATFEELRAAVESATASHDNVRAGVRDRIEALVDYADRNRDLILIIFGNDAEAAAVESELLDRFAALIAQGRSQRIAAGEMPAAVHPEVVSQALVGMVSRVICWWAADPTRVSREVVVETLTQIQLSGTHPEKAH